MFLCGIFLAFTTMDDACCRRMMRGLRLALILQLVLLSTCRGFLHTLGTASSAPYVPTTTGNPWIGSGSCQSSSSATTTTTTTTTTRLYEQQPRPTKPPRFVQKAHSQSPRKEKSTSTDNFNKNNNNIYNDNIFNNNNSNNNNKKFDKNQPTKRKPSPRMVDDRQESIDALEARLTKRWGTLPTSTNTNLGRPVVDPWDDATITEATFGDQEFYDEDDEGFEIIELSDEEYDEELKKNPSSLLSSSSSSSSTLATATTSPRSKKMNIGHLIAPEPVGGSGTKDLPLKKMAASSNESYFFNPNRQTVTASNKKQTATESTDSILKVPTTTAGTTTTTNNKKAVRTPSSQAILDNDGKPKLLTVSQALLQFQSTATDEQAVAASQSDTDSPIAVYQQMEKPSWTKIGITSPVLLGNLNAMDCSAPLSVQAKAIPHVLTGADVLVGTYTGSGKTLAFLTPVLQRLLWCNHDDDDEEEGEDPGLAVVIVAPGRELASQIASVARTLVENTPLRVQLAIGGTTFTRSWDQIRKRKPNILIGTPGRLAELIVGKPGEKSGKLKIGDVQTLILDEFDALLEYKPHREPTRAILQTLRRRHGDALQSIMCSATASDLMDSPQVPEYLRPGFATAMADEEDAFVTLSKSKRPQVSRTVMHGVVHVPHRRFALDTVRRILHTEPIPQQILIFAESAHKVDIVVEKLAERGIVAAPLHGGKGSDKMDRADVSKALREGYVGIVVATELAARGLDAPLLTHVINLDLPTDASHYAHRAGRCGRGGRPGVVINLTTSPKERNVPLRFAETLGIDMHTVEPRDGKLMVVDPETQTIDS